MQNVKQNALTIKYCTVNMCSEKNPLDLPRILLITYIEQWEMNPYFTGFIINAKCRGKASEIKIVVSYSNCNLNYWNTWNVNEREILANA